MWLELQIGYKIGKFLISQAYKKLLDKKIAPDQREPEAIIVLEVARPIVSDVEKQLGKVTAIIRYERQIDKDQLHEVTAEVYKAIASAQGLYKHIILVLSGPVVLSFLIGQVVGLNHFSLSVAWWQKGQYIIVNDMSNYRHLLF